MPYTPGEKITYPYLVTHKNHVAFRTKDPETMKVADVIWPGTPPIGYEEKMKCGTCGQGMTILAVVAGLWRVTYSQT